MSKRMRTNTESAGVIPAVPGKRRGRSNGLTERTRFQIWVRSAGRCQFCNCPLLGDLMSGNEDGKFGFVAHIVADAPDGPRGDPVRSPHGVNEVSNVMLLCSKHHKLIDVDEVDNYPEARLLEMKAAHEKRISDLTAMQDDRASHALCIGANIGSHESPVSFSRIRAAMLPERYPADGRAIQIETRGSAIQDTDPEFWATEAISLRRQFKEKVRDRIQQREIEHLSVFGLAPQPLLIELGRLLCDITPADVHQLHREPQGWRWAENGDPIDFRVRRPTAANGPPALILGLSASIVDERVTSVLGSYAAIWSITAEKPHNDIMRRKGDLRRFRELIRSMLNEIKSAHGEAATIAVFPALPVSAAIEVGRVWMPKADLPLLIYDQQRAMGGFVPAVRIENTSSKS